MFIYRRHTDEEYTPYSDTFMEDGNYDYTFKKTQKYLGGMLKKEITYNKKVNQKSISKENKKVGF
jgi:hypothetical protein